MGLGFRTSPVGGFAAPPYTNGPYSFSEHVNFSSASIGGSEGDVWFVDGTNGATTNTGKGWSDAFSTITLALAACGDGDTIYVTAKDITDRTGDPTSYAEVFTISNSSVSLIGVSRGRTQGGLPQVKIGSGSTAMCTITAPGCLITNMGFNGASSTGGGILLSSDYSATDAFGTSIIGCHFKNCKVTTTVADGGAIYTTTTGNNWQCLISGNKFYKNEVDVCLTGTSSTVPQDWVIENNVFSGPAANVNCNLYLKGGSGINGLVVNNNIFPCDPALSSGDTNEAVALTGCVGIFSNNFFGCTGLTFGDGTTTGGDIPTTMFMVANYQEDAIITRTS